jgi:adenylylsulfate kinase
MATEERNIVWHEGYVPTEEFEKRNGHQGGVLWFTGLSGSGKSTIAREVEWRLFEMGKQVFVLDGDNVRHGLNKDLGFSPEDRQENIRRIGEVAKLFRNQGNLVLTAFISPYRADRAVASDLFQDGSFHEIFVDCPVEECIQRDPKGLYKKAMNGEIQNFTGIQAPYEAPEQPALTVNTQAQDLAQSVEAVIQYLQEAKVLS